MAVEERGGEDGGGCGKGQPCRKSLELCYAARNTGTHGLAHARGDEHDEEAQGVAAGEVGDLDEPRKLSLRVS